jgi:hypothetical protein
LYPVICRNTGGSEAIAVNNDLEERIRNEFHTQFSRYGELPTLSPGTNLRHEGRYIRIRFNQLSDQPLEERLAALNPKDPPTQSPIAIAPKLTKPPVLAAPSLDIPVAPPITLPVPYSKPVNDKPPRKAFVQPPIVETRLKNDALLLAIQEGVRLKKVSNRDLAKAPADYRKNLKLELKTVRLKPASERVLAEPSINSSSKGNSEGIQAILARRSKIEVEEKTNDSDGGF